MSIRPRNWIDLKYIFSLLLAGAASCATLLAQPAAGPRAAKPLVVVITIHGFPARALQDPQLPMPTLRALAANGAVSSAMRPINPTVTWPNHTALISGVDAS